MPAVIDIPDEIIEAGKNFNTFAPVALKIQTMDGELIPFAFNPVQVVLGKIRQDIVNNGRLIRMWALKARREGVTTDTTARFYYKTTHARNRYAYHITHEPEATDFVFKMVKRYYDNAPLRPQTRYNNTTLLEFNTKDGQGGLDSAIRVGTAGKLNLGSGQLIHYLHLSEIAKWPEHTIHDLLTSLLQCVPAEPDTELIAESTANGLGGEFYDGFWGARFQYEVFLNNGVPDFQCRINPDADRDNIFSSVFIPWFVFPKYQMDPDQGFQRTTEEREMVKLYGINDCHLQWRRWSIANLCRGDVNVFKQEYPSNAREAFLASGRPVFDVVKCHEKITLCPKPVVYYDCITSIGQFVAKTPQIEGDTDGLLQVWQETSPGVPYVISADVSEGIEIGKGTDFHSADVFEQLTGKQVAHWHGKCEPIQFGILLSHIGYRYNTAWLVPERNNHGTAVVGKLSEIKYPNLYGEETPNPPHKPVKRYGWLTRGGQMGDAKALVIDNLVELVNKNMDGIQCPDTLREMITYKHAADGTLSAESGCHDDRVMSYAIGQWVRKRLPLPSALRAARATRTGPVVPSGALV